MEAQIFEPLLSFRKLLNGNLLQIMIEKQDTSQSLEKPIQQRDDEKKDIDLRDLFSALWKGKWVIIIFTAVFAVGAVFFAIKQPNTYSANALLAPTESSDGGALSKMSGQLGGLAAIAGVNLGGSEASRTDLAVQVIQSRQFIDKFISEHEILVPLMATKGWNLEKNSLLIDSDIYDTKTKSWLRAAEGLITSEPTPQEASSYFKKEIFSIEEDKESGFYLIKVSHFSPYIAKQWVDFLIDDINKVMRERAIEESTKNLAYLNSQLNKTAVADMQSMFYKLIEEQTKSLMLAKAQEEFVFKTIDPAVVPEIKAGPQRALICVLGTMLGFMLGVFIIFVRFLFVGHSSNKK